MEDNSLTSSARPTRKRKRVVRFSQSVIDEHGTTSNSSDYSDSDDEWKVLGDALSGHSGTECEKVNERDRANCSKKKRKVLRKKMDKPHQCPHCPMRFPFPNKMRRHIENKHSKKHECSRCGAAFDIFEQLRVHWATDHRRRFKCDHCDYTHHKKAEIRRHTFKQHVNGVKCPVKGCTATMAFNRIRRHLSSKHPSEDHSVLIREMPRVNQKCEWCTYETEDPDDYEKHLDSAHGSGVPCPVLGCQRKVLLRHLSDHLRLDHPGEDVLLPSHVSDDDLDNDMVSGPSIMSHPHSAPITNNWKLEEQQLSESEEERDKPNIRLLPTTTRHAQIQELIYGTFKCSECDKGFSNKDNLRKHVARVHDKRYGKEKRHMRYKCDRNGCTKAFTTPGKLDDHLNTHDGISPHGCPKCDRAFSGRELLAKHLKRYHQMSIKDVTIVSKMFRSATKELNHNYETPNCDLKHEADESSEAEPTSSSSILKKRKLFECVETKDDPEDFYSSPSCSSSRVADLNGSVLKKKKLFADEEEPIFNNWSIPQVPGSPPFKNKKISDDDDRMDVLVDSPPEPEVILKEVIIDSCTDYESDAVFIEDEAPRSIDGESSACQISPSLFVPLMNQAPMDEDLAPLTFAFAEETEQTRDTSFVQKGDTVNVLNESPFVSSGTGGAFCVNDLYPNEPLVRPPKMSNHRRLNGRLNVVAPVKLHQDAGSMGQSTSSQEPTEGYVVSRILDDITLL